jgi:RNA polymerase sigma factor (sigma-70 family)
MLEIDPVLDSFVRATTREEQEGQLEQLVVMQAIPIIRRVLRQRLGFYVNARGENRQQPDAADLFHEILVRVLQRIRSLQTTDGTDEIRDFGAYVSRTAGNACHDYLRSLYPVRHLLKNRIRYLLTDRKELVWREERYRTQRTIVCGLAVWPGELWDSPLQEPTVLPIGEEPMGEWLREKIGVKGQTSSTPLIGILVGILRLLGQPIELDRLVHLVALVLGTREWMLESIDDAEDPQRGWLPDPHPRADQQLEEEELLRRLWQEIQSLPLVQRRIVLLGQGDEQGHDLWSLFLEAATIPLSDLIAAVELEQSQIAQLWSEIPLDTSALAEFLQLTRTQVIRWKFYARQRLRKQLQQTSRKPRRKKRASSPKGTE